MPDWYYEYNGKAVGPVPQIQMHEWAKAGSINRDQLVRVQGSDQWQRAELFMELWQDQSSGHIPPSRAPSPSLFPMFFSAFGAAAFVMMVTWLFLSFVGLLKMIPFVGKGFISCSLGIVSLVGIACLGIVVGLLVRVRRGILISIAAGIFAFLIPYGACWLLLYTKADIVIAGKPGWLPVACAIAGVFGCLASLLKFDSPIRVQP